jgi:lysophospholipase L1-like esterase
MKIYTIRFYKVAAIVVLNTLVLLVAIELLAGAVINIVNLPGIKDLISEITGHPNDLIAFYEGLPYYADKDWSPAYWNELKSAVKKTYSPYVIWRSPSFDGNMLKIDASGLRRTPAAECVSDAYRVFVFGGSSIWGWGSPDWGTIPAVLQSKLSEIHNEPVCVVNYGENAYVSTQSLVQLILLLESGNVPDVVVFYDGVNDVLSASQSGRPLVHQNLAEIAALFQDRRHPIVRLAQSSNSYQLLQMVLSQIRPAVTEPESMSLHDSQYLADQISEAYLNNLQISRSLANTYGFELYFFWQPYILIGNKPLSMEEQNMVTGLNWVLDLNPRLVDLFRISYENIDSATSNNENLYYLGDIFDSTRESVWIDTWGHITPRGNEIVSEEILRVMKGSHE